MKTQFDLYKIELGKKKYDTITDRNQERDLILSLGTHPPQDTIPKNIEAFHKLINANLRFVMYVLKEFSLPATMSIMDIIQEGNLGLMIGICRFDAVKYPDIKLFSFVVHWIRFFIRASLAKNKVYESKRTHLMTEEMLETTSRVDKDIEAMFTTQTTELNLSHNTMESVGMADINDFLLTHLDNREAAIIRLYFGLSNDGDAKTLEAIGQQLHIKFVRVRQIRDRALAKLKKLIDSDQFQQYF